MKTLRYMGLLVASLVFGSVGSAGADTVLYEGVYGGHDYKSFYVSGLSWNQLSWDQVECECQRNGSRVAPCNDYVIGRELLRFLIA